MSEEESRSYDYIVCGGGNSGCVVAGRLAEDRSTSVLLIEAGPHPEMYPAISIPGASGSLFGTEADWKINSEPSPGINNRSIPLVRGKFIGGCSGLNGTLCVRGMKQDYDDWDIEGWSGAEVFKYISKAEKYCSKPWFDANEEGHGTSGPIPTAASKIAPISELLLEAYQSKGMPLAPDMFSTGEISHGCGYAIRTVHNGIRSTAANYVLNEYVRDRFTIKTNTLVDKILLDTKGDSVRATGVKAVLQDGSKVVFKANKEIILSAGPYYSPAILLRSGIGPKEEVEKHSIRSVVDLPGVGKNLMDHLIVWLFYEVSKPELTIDHLLIHGNKRAEAIKTWMTDRSGPLTSFPFGAFAFARLDDRLAKSESWKSAPREPGRDPMGLGPNQPNVELFNTEAYGGAQATSPITTESAFAMLVNLFGPQSRGTVVLKSAHPHDNPIVDHKYLGHELDALVLAEGCALANEIVMSGDGVRDVVKNSWPRPSALHKNVTGEDWMGYVRDMATTSYHPAGTCKMGKSLDPLAVVDSELRVFGIEGLRVADTSIIPMLPSGHLQMPAYGIGEKAADMIKAAKRG